MKKIKCSFFLLVAAGFIVSISSCKKGLFNDTEKETDFIVNDVPFSIPALKRTGEFDSITSFYYKVNMDSLVKTLDGKFDTLDLQSAYLTSCELSLTDKTTPDNFRNLHTCTIGMETAKLPFISRLARKTDIVDTPAYYLHVPDAYNPNMNHQLMADSVRYIIYGNIRDTFDAPVTGTAKLVFHLKLSR
jgi:hypothetical protein